MNFDMLEFEKSGSSDDRYEPTELQTFEAQKGIRGKGLVHKVSPEEKEKAQRIVGQLHEAEEVLEKDKKVNSFTDRYDVFDHAEEVLKDFYIKEAHMSIGEAKKISKKMAELYKIVEGVDELIYENTKSDGVPDRKGIWEDVVKITRGRLENIHLSPAKIEVVLEDLYKKKSEWIWEPQRKLKPLLEKSSKEDVLTV